MISYQTAAPGEPLQRVENDTPVPQGSEVLVKMVACGVCHSDIHLHDGEFNLGNDKNAKKAEGEEEPPLEYKGEEAYMESLG